jgi:hypothetical protein
MSGTKVKNWKTVTQIYSFIFVSPHVRIEDELLRHPVWLIHSPIKRYSFQHNAPTKRRHHIDAEHIWRFEHRQSSQMSI